MMMDFGSWICFVALLGAVLISTGVASWKWHRAREQQRIHKYIEDRGGQLLSIEAPKYRVLVLDEDAVRTYVVHFVDQHGTEHRARCLTIGWRGVFLADDCIVTDGGAGLQTIEALAAENRRLRAELDMLRQPTVTADSTAIKEP
jgi:hypothetical protein